MATTTTNFGWDIPQSTDLVKDGATAIAALGQDIDTALVDLKGGTTGQILAKNSDTDLDYTWINNDQGDITAVTAGTGISGGGTSGAVTITNSMATEITASGDIIVGTGSGTFDNLPIGTTGQVLTADTTVSPYKVKWATAASGGMTLLSTTTLSSSSVTVSNISQDYNSLFIMISEVGIASNNAILSIRPNSATTTFYGAGTTFFATANYGAAYAENTTITAGTQYLRYNDGSGNWALWLYNYASTTGNKGAFLTYGYRGAIPSISSNDVIQTAGTMGGYYYTASAITSLNLTLVPYAGSPTFNAGNVKIYGVK